MIKILNRSIYDTCEILKNVSESFIIKNYIAMIGLEMITAIRNNKKIMFIGNGGSAADCQHFAAELVVKFKSNRLSIPAIALTTDTSILTATGNDFGFDEIFSKQVEGLGNPGDILFAITTSGKSPNILKAIKVAKEKGIITCVMTGLKGRYLKEDGIVDYGIIIPSEETPRIQEIGLIIGHSICEFVEQTYKGEK